MQLKQRHDLIPNLVETVKGYAAHERGTLEEVVKLRNAAMTAQGPAQQAAAENMLTGALGKLFALAEAYPDLKANQNFQQLQTELADIENKLAAARRFFNNAVQEYNTGIQQFPAALFAGITRLQPADLLRRRRGARRGGKDAAGEILASEARNRRERTMAAAYGLYSHIQSNKRRSIALLLGLFFLVYVMVFAGALLAEALMQDASLPLAAARRRWRDLIWAAPCGHARHGALDRHRLSVQPVADRRRHRRPVRSRARNSPGSTICWKTSASRAASPCRSSR